MSSLANAADSPTAKPNVIVYLSDDVGWAEFGFQGCKDIPTPNIDSIANSGVKFTNAYVAATVCSPSRAGLMTGRYPTRFGHEFNGGDDQKYYDDMLARMAAESAKNGATVNVDQRGSHFEVKQDLRGEDPDAVFLNMQKGVAREALAFVASPYTPA